MVYKVLIVDDEKIIVEGISSVIDWEALDLEVIGTARNGIDAYEKIVMQKPDIVISDIRMPGIDGISLVSKVSEELPFIKFILLSGFSEFEYARSAMQYGVKHYLLKPCNEDKITAALKDIKNELNAKMMHHTFNLELQEKYKQAKPYIKAQLLTEFLAGKSYSSDDLSHYRFLFDNEIDHQQVRVILFKIECEFSYEYLFAIKNIGGEIFESPLLSTNINESVLFILEDNGDEEILFSQIERIRELLYRYYKQAVTVAISDVDEVQNVRKLYLEANECLEYRFYLGEGTIITQKDIFQEKADLPIDFTIDEQWIGLKIKSGHINDICKEIESIFNKMADLHLEISLTKSYCIQLYFSIIKTADNEQMKDYLYAVSKLLSMETVQQMKEYLETMAKEISNVYYNRFKSKQSSIIKRVIAVVNENLNNPDLSLKMVANDILYMNPDYLGKLFKQETGQRFSAYLTKLRIEKAVEIILKMDDVKVGMLAEMIGFGNNPQYFSQVFKKHTGYTPSEYQNSK
ncbi:response regulator transcription factor [Niallia sp.]|uniref:response regulator transcription factor n=1 Tax=Niallia sp. TaxID=2837523 RepID=UPI00289C3BE1|nr:response regulator transcription factor [Niallia sp.]